VQPDNIDPWRVPGWSVCQHVSFHPTSELLAGNWRESRRVGLEEVGEAQGEGIAIAADGTV
jgi:hypothetical protein